MKERLGAVLKVRVAGAWLQVRAEGLSEGRVRAGQQGVRVQARRALEHLVEVQGRAVEEEEEEEAAVVVAANGFRSRGGTVLSGFLDKDDTLVTLGDFDEPKTL